MRYAIFLFAALAMAETAPIAGENVRLSALQAIFPGMRISLATDLRIDDSWPEQTKPNQLDAPDALAKEAVYRVAGPAANKTEEEASAHLITGKASSTRLVRFQIFPWPDHTGLLAVLQYKFEGALPSMACPSIGLLVQLGKKGGGWAVRDRHVLETMHHTSLKRIQMLNLDGGGADQLIVESDFGGAGTWGINLLVFNLADKFERIFKITSQVSSENDMFVQSLEVPATIQMRARQFCFDKTTMVEDGIAFAPVRVSKLCYKPDEFSARSEPEARDKLLAPIHRP